jgi:hypothetical protein
VQRAIKVQSRANEPLQDWSVSDGICAACFKKIALDIPEEVKKELEKQPPAADPDKE